MLLNGSTIAIKTHEGWQGRPKFNPNRYDKAIVVVRDVYGSVLAEYKRRHMRQEEWGSPQMDRRITDRRGGFSVCTYAHIYICICSY